VIDELKKREWSRKELAQRIGIDATLINSMLRGERRFNEDQVIAIGASPSRNAAQTSSSLSKSMFWFGNTFAASPFA